MLTAGSLVGPYKILARLGAGGMGEVYRARDTRLGREVALKVIAADSARDPHRIKRFEQEARAAGALSHPNVCTIFDIGTHDGSPFVVMELLEGESLRERLGGAPIPASKAAEWVAQAARALAAAHEKGIVHRDLKPENLFLTRDGRVKVLDFGLAKLLRPEAIAGSGKAPVSVASTAPGAVLGTAGYMAPEQVRGEPTDHRVDLFALGAILYELLSGTRAFAGTGFYDTSYRIVNEEPAPLSASGREVPAGLEAIVRRCLEKRPPERFQAALDLAFALESLALAPPAVTPGRRQGSNGRGWPRPGVVAAVLLGIAVLAIGILAGAAGRGWRGTAAPVPAYQRLTVDRGRIFSARFSPDGRSIVYAAAWEGHPVELYEVRPGQPSSRSLGLQKANLLSVNPNGTLAVALDQDNFTGWARSGTLAELPATGGEPRQILEGVLSGDWTPDGGTLAVARDFEKKVRLEMPPGQVLFETAGRLAWVRVAAAGEWVAFVENPVPPDTRGSVVIVDRAGRVVARTQEWNHILGAAWSADGREVWYSATQDGGTSELMGLTPAGAQRLVHRFPGYMVLHDIAQDGRMLLMREHLVAGIRGRSRPDEVERELGWLDWSTAYDISRDGRMLLFDEQGLGGGTYYSVCLRDMDGSAPVRLGEGHGCSLSPDGRTVLVVHFGMPNRLSLVPTGAGETVTMPRGTIERYRGAQWLPDGRRFVFAGAEAGRPWRTWLQDAGGASARPVTPEGISGVSVSPNGRFVAATDQDRLLLICPIDGGDPSAVARLLPDEIVLGWSPDGRAIYAGERGSAMAVSSIDLATGRRAPWRRFELSDPAGACVWNAHLTPDGTGYAYSYIRWVDELYLVDGLK